MTLTIEQITEFLTVQVKTNEAVIEQFKNLIDILEDHEKDMRAMAIEITKLKQEVNELKQRDAR